jgi:APA family basic amino acid/polyamine antiporter
MFESKSVLNVDKPDSSKSESFELHRSISLPLLLLYGLGTILGAGIYVLIGQVAGLAGHSAPLSFLIAAVVAGFTGFSYAELSARYPLSAGEAVYVQEAFGLPFWAVLVGLAVATAGIVSAAAVTRGAVGYMQVFVAIPTPILIIGSLLILGAIAAWGISESLTVAAAFTVMEIGGLMLIIWVGRDAFSASNFHISEFIPGTDTANWQGIFIGGFLAFFAYIGFEDMVNVAEEVKNPQRNLPLAIIFAVSIATVFYLSIAIVAVHLASPDELITNDAPLAFLFQRATGTNPWLISIISIFAVINGALIQIIMASRMLYGMSRKKWLPAIFGRVHPHTRTPLIASFTIVALVMTFALLVPLVALASVTSFVLLMVFILINLALINIKRRVPVEPGVMAYPLWVPVMGALSCCALLISQLLPLMV